MLPPPAPLLRWPGGKTSLLSLLLNRIERLCPAGLQGDYFEPFLGGGTLFFALAHSPLTAERRSRPGPWAHLSDVSPEIIGLYKAVQAEPDEVWRHLSTLVARYSAARDHEQRKAIYLAERDQLNWAIQTGRAHGPVHGGRVIFLSKTNFNGLWRVNQGKRDPERGGTYNVPHGRPSGKGPSFPSLREILSASAALDGATLRLASYSPAFAQMTEGDLLFADPPYGGVQGHVKFVEYALGGFSAAEQRWLCLLLWDAHRRGVRSLVTNGDFPGNRAAYAHAGLCVETTAESRAINVDTTARKAVDCLLGWG